MDLKFVGFLFGSKDTFEIGMIDVDGEFIMSSYDFEILNSSE